MGGYHCSIMNSNLSFFLKGKVYYEHHLPVLMYESESRCLTRYLEKILKSAQSYGMKNKYISINDRTDIERTTWR